MEDASVRRPATLRDLIGTCPEGSPFIAGVVLAAHEIVGYGKEMERQVSSAVVSAFISTGIVGDQIIRLMEFTEGDAVRAYDVLTVPEELERFRSLNSEQAI